MATKSVSPSDLQRIGVSVGPGAFTGVRVGLAFAKGLAFALKIPILGFTTLHCLAAQARVRDPNASVYVAAIDARRGEIYVQAFDAILAPLTAPAVLSRPDAVKHISSVARGPVVVAEASGAAIGAKLAEAGSQILQVLAMDRIESGMLARLTLTAKPEEHPATPCYVRDSGARQP
jgi:tRNA threonylcarbamoyladenosine biosynthesis protein TsaB